MKNLLPFLTAIGIATTSSQAFTISLDNSAAATLNSTTLSSFTVDGANTHRMLLVAIAGELGTSISGITYGTTALTPIALANQGSTDSFSEIWVLDGVDGGTDDITVNGLSGSNGFQFGAISLYSTQDLVISDTDTVTNPGSGATSPGTLSMNIATDDFVFTMGQANFDSSIATSSLANNLFNYSTGGAGFSFSADYENNPGAGDILYTWGGSNRRHALAGVVVSAVPEPSSTALLGSLGLLALLRRRR